LAVVVFIAMMAGALAPAAVVAAEGPGNHGAGASAADQHDVSPPLRAIHVAAPSAANLTERPLYRLNSARGSGPDTALQTTTGTSVAVSSPSGFEASVRATWPLMRSVRARTRRRATRSLPPSEYPREQFALE
jgi:hypothetical protein